MVTIKSDTGIELPAPPGLCEVYIRTNFIGRLSLLVSNHGHSAVLVQGVGMRGKGGAVLLVSTTVAVILVLVSAACGAGGGQAPGAASPAPRATVKGGTIHEIGGKPWEQVSTGSPLRVVSAKLFYSGLGESAYVLGELENTGSEPVKNITVGIKAYAVDGTVIDNRTWPVFEKVVAAGARTPYKFTADLREVVRFELFVESEPASPAEASLEPAVTVENAQMTEPKLGYVWVSGEVKNNSDQPVRGAEVAAVLRDAEGNVVELATTRVEQEIEPGQSVPFRFAVIHRDAVSLQTLAKPLE